MVILFTDDSGIPDCCKVSLDHFIFQLQECTPSKTLVSNRVSGILASKVSIPGVKTSSYKDV